MKIYAGVLCKVIGGTDGLNVGKTVRVVSLQGEHSKLGRIWRCTAVVGEIVTEYGAIGPTADFAQDWLEPLPPVTAKPGEQQVAA
jgi:hypothetical protein